MENTNTNTKVYDGKKVNINKRQDYVCYSHPTKLNEKGHVKQVTRSIKGLEDKQLNSLCIELDDLLVNFSDYTKDLKCIENTRGKFETKAFDWIIHEHLINNSDKIVKSTLENYVPISKNSMVYMNALNSFVFKDYIPENICVNNCQYVVLNDKETTDFSAVIEFKGYDCLATYILNLLVKVIYNYFNSSEKCEIKDILYPYIKLELDDECSKRFQKAISEIQKAYIKENKIKEKDFHVCANFNQYARKRIETENIRLIGILHDLITKKIELNIEKIENSKGCVCSKLNSKESIHKILHLKFNSDKESFFNVLDKMFSFSNPDESLGNFVKEIRLKGNFSKDSNQENICILNSYSIDYTDIINSVEDRGIKICLDGIFTNNYNLVNLLEKIIVFGGIEKCDFYCKSSPDNNDYYVLSEHLIELLSKLNIVNNFKSIYANDFILAKCDNSPNTKYLPIENKPSKSYNISDHYDSLTLNINSDFKAKIESLFDDEEFLCLFRDKGLKNVKSVLLESFVYSFYNHIFANDKLFDYDHNSVMDLISFYDKFMINNLNIISNKIDKIITNDLNKIYNNFKKIDDKSLRKQCILNAILIDIKIPYDYIKEVCVEYEQELKRK